MNCSGRRQGLIEWQRPGVWGQHPAAYIPELQFRYDAPLQFSEWRLRAQ